MTGMKNGMYYENKKMENMIDNVKGKMNRENLVGMKNGKYFENMNNKMNYELNYENLIGSTRNKLYTEDLIGSTRNKLYTEDMSMGNKRGDLYKEAMKVKSAQNEDMSNPSESDDENEHFNP